MRHIALVSALSFAVLAVQVGCNEPEAGESKSGESKSSKSDEKAKAKPTGPVFQTKMSGIDMSQPIVEKDLSGMELAGFTIQAPENAEIKKKSPRGFKLVSAGVNYSLTIKEGALDQKGIKEIFTVIDPKGELVVDEADRLIYKRASGSHLFHTETQVDGKPYTCSTVATAANFTRSEVDQMITSCKTLSKKGGA